MPQNFRFSTIPAILITRAIFHACEQVKDMFRYCQFFNLLGSFSSTILFLTLVSCPLSKPVFSREKVAIIFDTVDAHNAVLNAASGAHAEEAKSLFESKGYRVINLSGLLLILLRLQEQSVLRTVRICLVKI